MSPGERPAGYGTIGQMRPTTDAASTERSSPVQLSGQPAELQILLAEYSNLQANRALVYDEAFTRASMFLSFLGMSFVGLALLASAIPFDRDFLIVATIVLCFDFIVAVVTYVRVGNANAEDLRMVHAMHRVRHAYLIIAPGVSPFFVTGMYDDLDTVLGSYGPPVSGAQTVIHGLSTSAGMVGLIMSLVGGVLAAVVALTVGATMVGALAAGFLGSLTVFVIGLRWAFDAVGRTQDAIETRFPAPSADAEPATAGQVTVEAEPGRQLPHREG